MKEAWWEMRDAGSGKRKAPPVLITTLNSCKLAGGRLAIIYLIVLLLLLIVKDECNWKYTTHQIRTAS